MNLFILAKAAKAAASDHNDKHVIKMILECAQLLYTCWHFGRSDVQWQADAFPKHCRKCDAFNIDCKTCTKCVFKPYRATHRNHPIAIWTRMNKSHYDYTVDLGLSLCEEYTRRYGKVHRTQMHLEMFKKMGFPTHVGKETYTPPKHKTATYNTPEGTEYFYCAINDELWPKCATYTEDGRLDCIATYRAYYQAKDMDHKWCRGTQEPPVWFKRKRDDVDEPNAKRIKVI